jgi:hypothetical protein
MSKQTKKGKKNDKKYAKACREYTRALETYDLANQLDMSAEVRNACYSAMSSIAVRVHKLYDKYYL